MFKKTKSQAWWIALVTMMLGRQRQIDCWGDLWPASLAQLLNSRPVRDSASKDIVDSTEAMTSRARPMLCACTHTNMDLSTNMHTHKHMNTYVHKKLINLLKNYRNTEATEYFSGQNFSGDTYRHCVK